jgi:hypothetical protein
MDYDIVWLDEISKMTPNEIYNRNVATCKDEIEFVNTILECKRQMSANAPTHSHGYTIAPCKPAEPLCTGLKALAYAEKQLEGEKPMCYKTTSMPMTASVNVAALSQPTVEMTQRDFFSDRIRQETSRIERDVLRPQFFMDADDEPRNFLELIERIKSDDFTVDDEAARRVKESPKNYWGSTWGIRWGKNKPDVDGFDAARKALKQAAQNVIDEATLSPADKLLGLLNDFRNWTFTAKAEKAKK